MVKELHEQALEKLKTVNVMPYLAALRAANEGAKDDVLNTNGCANYQWIPGFVELLKPKQHCHRWKCRPRLDANHHWIESDKRHLSELFVSEYHFRCFYFSEWNDNQCSHT